MAFINTPVPGLLIFEPKVFEDPRGYFYESYNQKYFDEIGINTRFVQDNQSSSVYGVFRGFHYQKPPFAQAKLVRVLSGKVIDYAVDIRKGSPTFGRSFSLELSAENKRQLYIPRGFAHGFLVISERAEFTYKCDNFYEKSSEAGISCFDPTLKIEWPLSSSGLLLSDKDKILPYLEDADNPFIYGEIQ